MSTKLLPVFFLLSVFHACSTKVEEDEYEDGTTNQKWVLAPKTQDTDVTLILNKLLREYDKKLRPDIGIKPTVIDVDIYVNSIGPVSSINMLSTIEEIIRYRFLDWEYSMWKYMAMMTKLKTKLRTEEEMDVLETEEEELSKQKLSQAIKMKENMS
ncbi:PREDICTED: gamma-aminobutyric acid receptor subunit gamma-3-like [Corvus brachyrhynchos]|uniref:gamma-aminobutyric acid receptor subunit gamma-3-like n=1 Tax=Corvus brachyrhynchos TaxID=85066 RepID=UPI00081670C5|nr:PREDICTED: gamma-aminobutyric acid receptor subunit gamma-3-like [Corvus brachyrhynchos]